jgi:uncharacterized protein YecT (DUF1311 family)
MGDIVAEFLKGFLSKDWGQVLLAGTLATMLLAFVGAPRAISEMVGYVWMVVADNKSSFPFAIVLGAPAGLFAKNLREAAVLIMLGFIGLFLSSSNVSSDPAEVGQTIIGIAILLSIVAALTRCAKQFYIASKPETIMPDGECKDGAMGKQDPIRTRLAWGAVAIVGLTFSAHLGSSGWSSRPNYYEESYATAEVAAAGADAAAAGADAAIASIAPDPINTPMPEFSNNYGLGESQSKDELTYYPTSFDCSKDKSFVETSICSDQSLAAMDVKLNTAFQRNLKNLSGKLRAQFLAAERARLIQRSNCSTVNCIDKWYNHALAESDKNDIIDTTDSIWDRINSKQILPNKTSPITIEKTNQDLKQD